GRPSPSTTRGSWGEPSPPARMGVSELERFADVSDTSKRASTARGAACSLASWPRSKRARNAPWARFLREPPFAKLTAARSRPRTGRLLVPDPPLLLVELADEAQREEGAHVLEVRAHLHVDLVPAGVALDLGDDDAGLAQRAAAADGGGDEVLIGDV